MRVIVPGGTGFLGLRLCERLVGRGHDVVVLTRDAARSRDHIHPKAAVVSWAKDAPRWESVLDGAGAVVNLSGESLAKRWTEAAKARIAKSRVEAAERLYDAIAKAAARPPVLVNGSAVGYYGPHGDEELDEESPPGSGFLAETCVAWEAAARRSEALGVRVVRVRTGVVLGPGGGALAKLLPPFKAFAGGPLGSGTQWVSWIHRDDLVDLLVFAVENPDATGALNGTAPRPVRMKELATTLGRVLHRPSLIPVPAAALRALLGEMSTVVLDGQRVLPKRALALGFQFAWPELEPALRDVVGD